MTTKIFINTGVHNSMAHIKNLSELLILLLCFVAITFLSGCGGDETESVKSMEQIRSEEGIPVKVEVVEYKPFNRTLSFFSKLAGIQEATKTTSMGGKIEKIRANVGDHVAQDQVVIEFDTKNPGLQYEQSKNAYEIAEKTYQRTKALFQAGETSQANYDGAETQYLVSKRNYESIKQLLFSESPISGTIVDMKVNPGDNVKGDAHLFTVAQLHRMRTKIWASESEVSEIRKGMKAEITVNGKTYTGRVTEVSMAVDPFRQAFYAEVEFDNSKNELKSGVTVDVKILVYENPKAIIIPRNLVNTDPKGAYVYVDNNNSATKRYVTNGNDSGIFYEVSSGLNIGDRLIVQGQAHLDDGKKIKVIQ